jgi:hypothetical protein
MCRGTHVAAAERLMQVADVVAARRHASPRPGWAAIMVKAFALAAAKHPQMRQAYLGFPWSHVGEFAWQIAGVVVNRRIGDDDVILLGPLVRPETQSLATLDAHLRRYKEAPVESIREFREALLVARLPGFVRRFLWWLALHVLPSRRARHFGTFGVTTMSPFGAKTLQVPSFWPAFLHYGTINQANEIPVGVAFDHRLMDGVVVGFTLLEMEQALHHEILSELKSLRPAPVARAA